MVGQRLCSLLVSVTLQRWTYSWRKGQTLNHIARYVTLFVFNILWGKTCKKLNTVLQLLHVMWRTQGCGSSWKSKRLLWHIKMRSFEIVRHILFHTVPCNHDVLLMTISGLSNATKYHSPVTLFRGKASNRLLLLRLLDILIVTSSKSYVCIRTVWQRLCALLMQSTAVWSTVWFRQELA